VRRTPNDQRRRTSDRQRHDRFGPVPAPDTYVTVEGCSFQTTTTTESIDVTTIVTVSARVYLPVTVDTKAVTSRDAIRYRGRDYELRGPCVVATGLDGAEDHVWCLVEWQAG
jgi:hypothetical protein